MSDRLVDFTERSRRNRAANHGAGTDANLEPPRRVIPMMLPHVHEWDVDAIAMLKIDQGVVPAVASVRYAIDVDPLQRGYSVAIAREGWPSLILHDKRHPDETPEQAAKREAILWFINEVLSASYGVPA